MDLIKSADYKRTLITDSIDGEHAENALASFSGMNDILEATETTALVSSLQSLLDDNDMLGKTYLDLWLIKGVGKRADIAAVMGVSEREVTDIRRRLIYKIKPYLSATRNKGSRNKV